MALKIEHINDRKMFYGVLPVYELAILEYLNTAKDAAAIAGIEVQEGPVMDDPDTGFGRPGRIGYDIGLLVAERILEKRKKKGMFRSLEDLADIKGFGNDKLDDLLYTFTRLRVPLPTGLGQDFDAFINAVATLEMDGTKRKLKSTEIRAAIRKLLMDKSVPAAKNTSFSWDRILPDAAAIKIPAFWATEPALVKASNLIQKTERLTIGFRQVNMNYLFAGMEARLSRTAITTPDDRIKLGTTQELASFHSAVAHAAFEYMRKIPAPGKNWKPDTRALDTSYGQYSGADKLTAFADALNMDVDINRFITFNLLNYYTGAKDHVQRSYFNLSEKIGLGKLKGGIFENDTPAFRNGQVDKVLNTSFVFNIDNGKKDDLIKILTEGDVNNEYHAYKVSTAYLFNKFIDTLAIYVGMDLVRPEIVSWNRLEARPRTNEFKRVLSAEIRDALWMLSRQWQMGEFAAEDAGTAVEMRVDMETSALGKYSLHKRPAHKLDNKQPLETIVEQEAITPDLTLRLEMGKHWLRILKAKLADPSNPVASATIDTIVNDYKKNVSLHFTLPVPAGNHPEIYSDPVMLQWYAAVGNGRSIDGNSLYRALKTGTAAASYLSNTTPAITSLVNEAATAFIAWYKKTYSQPSNPADTAWDASHLEYQFHCSAPDSAMSTTVLAADEYSSGHLDWHNFDIETKNSNYDAGLLFSDVPAKTKRRTITVLPGEVQFPGMPNKRWWAFEDYKVDLGGIKGDTTEPAKLLLSEFALIYSNDWMLLPFDIDAGNICTVKSLIVKDVFGQYTQVQAAGSGDATDWQRWAIFSLTRRNYAGASADTRLLIPPTTVTVMESDPVESVNLLRDEMANMVWGVESVIPDGRGAGMEGWDAGRRLFNYLQSITVAPPVVATANNSATVAYQLGTTVPEHWIPFIPVRMNAVTSREIQLRRAAMPRIIAGRTNERIRPRTTLLRTNHDEDTGTWNPYFIFEEEVLRSGSIVELTWQRTRWTDGSVITWLGRRKYTGKGEANSGLEFDIIKNKG